MVYKFDLTEFEDYTLNDRQAFIVEQMKWDTFLMDIDIDDKVALVKEHRYMVDKRTEIFDKLYSEHNIKNTFIYEVFKQQQEFYNSSINLLHKLIFMDKVINKDEWDMLIAAM